MPGERPFELSPEELESRIEEMVDATFNDLSSEFLLMPTGTGFVRYSDFQRAYEVLKKETGGLENFTVEAIKSALSGNSLVFGVLRSVLGMSAPEWAELARVELDSDIYTRFSSGNRQKLQSSRLLSQTGCTEIRDQDTGEDRRTGKSRHSVH